MKWTQENANECIPLWRLGPSCDRFNFLADVAQLVARNLAKVQVAGSNPVVRSDNRTSVKNFHRFLSASDFSMVGWPRGEARDCKSLYTGSNPVPTSILI